MKKAGLLAVLFACFTLAFAAPGASANRWDGIEPRGNVDMTPARYNDNDTLGEDMREGYQNMKNGVQRATNRVETGVNRAANRVESGVNRTFDTRDNTMMNNRYRAAATTTTTDNNRGWDWGWLGLLGLLGLAGMRSRERDRA